MIAALAFGVYANSLSNPFVWDDPLFIVANPSIRSLSHVPSFFTKPWASERAQARYKKQGAIGWRPLALTSYSIDYALFGLSPTGFRISQLLLHLTASLAFLALARSLVPGVASLAVAAIFAVHPLHSEALNVVTYRTTLLFSLFYLLGLAAHVWGRRRGLRWPTLTLVPLAYAASCLSKEPGITLAAAVVWFDLATRRFVWRRVVDYLPLACVGAGYLVARALITEAPHYNVFEGLAGWQVALTQLKVLALDLSLLVWPEPLCAFYDWAILPPVTSLGDLQAIAGLLALTSLLALGAVALRRRIDIAAFATGWFILALLPYAHIIPHFDIAGDRFVYLPSAAFLLGLCDIVTRLCTSRGAVSPHSEAASGPPASAGYNAEADSGAPVSSTRGVRWLLVAGLLITLAYGALTIRRNTHWSSSQRMHEQMARDFPYGINAHIELGKIYYRSGRYRDAIRHLRRALQIAPTLAPARRLLEQSERRLKERP
ncbi:MAG: tetratricopeptide repeat protein [Myxococcales bacterium]|nr:tetratricopeptide repeat protein [Myxococcales bacterium]